jgi:hypothetical protein
MATGEHVVGRVPEGEALLRDGCSSFWSGAIGHRQQKKARLVEATLD